MRHKYMGNTMSDKINQNNQEIHIENRWSNAKAISWVTVGTGLFAIIFSSAKFADGSISTFQILFFRYIGGLLSLFLIASVSGGLRSYHSSKPFLYFLRAGFGATGAGAIMFASANMPIVDATALGLLYVVFIVPLGVIFLSDKITRQHLFGITLCGGGTAIIMLSRGAFSSIDAAYTIPAAVAILGAALLALEGFMIKVLSYVDKPLTVLLYTNAFGLFITGAFAAMSWTGISLINSFPYLILGVVAISAQYCIVRGYKLAALSIVAPVDYSWLIFTALIGYIFFNEVPTVPVIVGSCILAVGGTVLAIIRSTSPSVEAKDIGRLQSVD
ncbi:DMT family transporter [Rhizobium arsenicireducens]